MKHIPIVILNKDRLEPLKLLVDALKSRNYNNIIVIDNQSTYQPLLDWYTQSDIDVFYNDIEATKFDNGTFYRLAYEVQHPKFVSIIQNYYVFTDSDVVPVESAPYDFITDMISVLDKYQLHKVGLGLKIDDLPESVATTAHVVNTESQYWTNKLDDDLILYKAPVDTTFAVYAPNSLPLWGDSSIRMGGDYVAKHIPWYYDTNNLPEDELYYVTHLQYGRGPVYSIQVKELINK
jgi:hypothetical protein